MRAIFSFQDEFGGVIVCRGERIAFFCCVEAEHGSGGPSEQVPFARQIAGHGKSRKLVMRLLHLFFLMSIPSISCPVCDKPRTFIERSLIESASAKRALPGHEVALQLFDGEHALAFAAHRHLLVLPTVGRGGYQRCLIHLRFLSPSPAPARTARRHPARYPTRVCNTNRRCAQPDRESSRPARIPRAPAQNHAHSLCLLPGTLQV